MGFANSFLDAAKSALGRFGRKKKSGPTTERFTAEGNMELMDIRKKGNRKMMTGRGTRVGVDPEAISAQLGGRLPPRMWKKAAKGGYSE